MYDEQRPKLQGWGPIVLQSIVLLLAAFSYSASQEHRFTVIEETMRAQAHTIESIASTQQQMSAQIHDMQMIQASLASLNEFLLKKVK